MKAGGDGRAMAGNRRWGMDVSDASKTCNNTGSLATHIDLTREPLDIVDLTCPNGCAN